MARRRDRRGRAPARRERGGGLGRDAARLRLRRTDRRDHSALRSVDGPRLLWTPPVSGRDRRPCRRLCGSRPARQAGRGRERRRCARARCDHVRLGGRLALCTGSAAAEQPLAIRGNADARSRGLPRDRRLRHRRGLGRARQLVLDQAVDRLHLPRLDRVADRLLGLCVAAEERPNLGRRDVRVRQSRRRGRARHGVPERDDRLDDDRGGRRDRDRRRPDRDGAYPG